MLRLSSTIFVVAVAALSQTPTFRAGTKLVEVDVVARRGNSAATGLTKDDFTVFDNGKPRQIAFFSVRSRSAPGSSAPPPLPPGFVSNRLTRAGEPFTDATVFFLDQKNTPRETQIFAIERIRKFLRGRRPGDRIGIYTFLADGSVHATPELTDDADLLNRAANSLQPQNPTYRSSIEDMPGPIATGPRSASEWAKVMVKERHDDTRHALETIARHLAGVPGRKSLIWISTAFPIFFPSPDDPEVNGMPDMDAAARALSDADVAVYSVDPRGLVGALSGVTAIRDAQSGGPQPQVLMMQTPPGGNGLPSGDEALHLMATLTGGKFVNNGNAIEDSFRDAIEDGELTYTLGFYPAQDDRDAQWHKLKVTVDRRGVTLRYREQYFAAKESEVALQRPTLDRLLKQNLDATELELRAAAVPDAVHSGSLDIKVNVDLHDVELQHENGQYSGAVDVSFYVEGTGKMLIQTFRIEIPDDRFAGFLEKGFDTTASLDAAGGIEALRVVVQDRATGAAGTVTLPLPRGR